MIGSVVDIHTSVEVHLETNHTNQTNQAIFLKSRLPLCDIFAKTASCGRRALNTLRDPAREGGSDGSVSGFAMSG